MTARIVGYCDKATSGVLCGKPLWAGLDPQAGECWEHGERYILVPLGIPENPNVFRGSTRGKK